MSPATYVALLTSPGRGALATIEVRGPHARQFTQACLDRPIEQSEDDAVRPWLRQFRGDQGGQEELVVSFPTLDIARIHCHGGLAACENILRSLESQGAIRVGWQDFADPWRIALAGALTERTALHLLDQAPAAWRSKINELLEMLQQPSRVHTLIEQLDELLAFAPLGLHLTEPWRVVIAGRPNAGKSSLLNALLGYHRSIIHDEPGTTRDVVTARTAFDGWPVELRDTAGLRQADDELEAAGVQRAEEEIRAADLVLYVIPADAKLAEIDSENIATEQLRVQGLKVLVIRSKCDLGNYSEPDSECTVSAKTAEGIPQLIATVVKRLIPNCPLPGTFLPFNYELVECLNRVRAALLRREADVVRRELWAAQAALSVALGN